MEQLNERIFSTDELKKEANKVKEKTIVSLEKVPGYKALTPDQKAILKYNVGAYNKVAKEFNNLRSAMVNGRVPDAQNPKAVANFRKLNVNATKLYKKTVAPTMRAGASAEKKTELSQLNKKAADTKMKNAQELASFKEKVKELARKQKEM
jgi:hypothetical protein